MDEVVEDFIESPHERGLDICTKKQLIRIAEYYKVDIGDARKTKDHVKGNLAAKLLEKGVLLKGKVDTSLLGGANPVGLSFEQQKELLLLRIKAEHEKEQAMETMRQDLEREKLDVERQRLALIREGKLEGAAQEVGGVTEGNLELKSYLPFITEGFVSLKGSKEQGEVSVGVRPALPVDGVAMILGNDIAGDKVWADVSPPARVTVTPLECSKPDESELWPLVLAYSYLLFPGLFLMMSYCMSRKLTAL
ncbi:hypothetical protein F2P79_024490 [Pimephales promelas]|nr:hypothetical protein F2P79_024490 [Pimephales promelas]